MTVLLQCLLDRGNFKPPPDGPLCAYTPLLCEWITYIFNSVLVTMNSFVILRVHASSAFSTRKLLGNHWISTIHRIKTSHCILQTGHRVMTCLLRYPLTSRFSPHHPFHAHDPFPTNGLKVLIRNMPNQQGDAARCSKPNTEAMERSLPCLRFCIL